MSFSLPMLEASFARVPELLQKQGVLVEPHDGSRKHQMLRCSRDGTAVLLGVVKPAHWATATDERRDLVMVAAIEESLFRVWRIPRERRMRGEIIEMLRPLEWRPQQRRLG